MANSYNILSCAAVLSSAAYLGLIVYQIWSFLRSDTVNDLKEDNEQAISIIIPFRNEARNILNLIKDLERFAVDNQRFEVILVDDHSEDTGRQLILGSSHLDQQVIVSNGIGKKAAIHTGVQLAKFNIIATLDADVSVTKGWIQELLSFFSNQKNGFLILPVVTKNEKGIWGNFEALDVLSLTGTTISWAKARGPILCNGANMAFRKSLYIKYRVDNSDRNLASGDDLFFLHEIKKNERKVVGYSSSPASIARVETFNSAKKLINQRARWISKTAFYKDKQTIRVAGIVFFNYFLTMCIGIGAVFYPSLIKLFFILFGTKFIVDFLYLFLLARKFNKLKILPWYPLSAVLQFFFVPIVYLTSKFAPFEWKGRKYKR